MVCTDDKYNDNNIYNEIMRTNVWDDDDDVNFSFKSIYIIMLYFLYVTM